MSKPWLCFLLCWALYVALIGAPLWSVLLAGGLLLAVSVIELRSRGG